MHHFTDLLSSLRNIEKYMTDPSFKTKVLSKVSRAILEHFGKRHARIVNKAEFRISKDKVLNEIFQYDNSSFLQTQIGLIEEIVDGNFLSIDHERVEIRQKKRKPTKYERNDRRREKENLARKLLA